eukprot:TRINITY_DN20902_c0_g1::TRINITY_DN20902_c0_g1_i1::g.12417::m.12417 TRINITY_DN20902_c0_g1::TRINITY_DN20902_c0_g1_i1::g.12417  ORF type:complete len:210 (-),score=3.57,sp/Q8K0T2/DC2L1_MOUSE/33.82/7e-34,DLIC/PF05783.6/2.3e-06,Miro/PF08477.8/4.3e-06,Arf/PF00025.16/0.0013,Arf/PF00025.16/1.5e+02,SRPRB/PF09439.5/0.0026,Gtr1_RagA/PF04670.7/0.0071,Ras/PF00071.17/0.02,Ras/PF00071.17/1.1e+03,MMR_HSR1/PF01926.18/0.083 TRINITY_DN20902_c0_g1_i1:264-893(-)
MSRNPSSISSKDIWSSTLKQKRDEASKRDPLEDEAHVIFVGGKQSGKSSLVYRLLDTSRGDVPVRKPTVALEYSYARRPDKQVAHIWELGGGKRMSKLLETCLTAETVHVAIVVIVLDLAYPAEAFEELEFWLTAVRACADSAMKQAEKSYPYRHAALLRKCKASIPEGHPDREYIGPMPVTTLVVANKWDTFQNDDAEKRKVLGKALR